MRILILFVCFTAARLFAAENARETPGTAAKAQNTAAIPKNPDGAITSPGDLILLEKNSRSLPPLVASPDEDTIAQLTAGILTRSHYLHRERPLNDEVSSQFLDRYVEMLDGLRLHFLQPDLKSFESYRTKLDDLIKDGDTRPAREIFKRFRQHVEERISFVAELLKNEKFEFTGNDRFSLDRRKAEYPKDLTEAKQLWRQYLRYEYLQEKLSWKKPAAVGSGRTTPDSRKDEGAKTDPNSKTAPTSLHDEIVKTLAKRYARILRFWREFDNLDVFQTYLTALAHVYDPHSDYMDRRSFENFAINMNLSLFGIGALLQSEDGYCKVKELKPGPAMLSKKIKPGDRIVAVAQGDDEPVEVVDMKLSTIVEMIRGPKGTTVRLTLVPVDASDPSQRSTVSLVRDEIKLEDEEAKAKIIEVPGTNGKATRLGVIDLSSFYAHVDLRDSRGLRIAGEGEGSAGFKSSTADVARLLKKLKEENVAGIVLDLRRNGGGSLEEAINLTGLFIKEGPVVQVKDYTGKIDVDEDADPTVLYDGPLVVLTSRFSASASEILAGALQDYGRALIVGESTTHGKGTVQSLIQLEPYVTRLASRSTNNPGALKITIRKFYRASGSSTQLKGVTPDIVLPSVYNYAEVGEGALENPLAWDTIASADYEKLNRVQPILSELRRRSEGRVASDKDFDYLREDIEQYRKYLADKSVSLNEEVRLKEKQENETKAEARKKERKSRHEPEEKIYELTLKQTLLPGLPPPAAKTNETAKADADKPGDEADDETDVEEKTPAIDAALKESKRILLDLISLSSRETVVAGRN